MHRDARAHLRRAESRARRRHPVSRVAVADRRARRAVAGVLRPADGAGRVADLADPGGPAPRRDRGDAAGRRRAPDQADRGVRRRVLRCDAAGGVMAPPPQSRARRPGCCRLRGRRLASDPDSGGRLCRHGAGWCLVVRQRPVDLPAAPDAWRSDRHAADRRGRRAAGAVRLGGARSRDAPWAAPLVPGRLAGERCHWLAARPTLFQPLCAAVAGAPRGRGRHRARSPRAALVGGAGRCGDAVSERLSALGRDRDDPSPARIARHRLRAGSRSRRG